MKDNSKDTGRKETFHTIDVPYQERVGVRRLQAYSFASLVHFYGIDKVWLLATFISFI